MVPEEDDVPPDRIDPAGEPEPVKNWLLPVFRQATAIALSRSFGEEQGTTFYRCSDLEFC